MDLENLHELDQASLASMLEIVEELDSYLSSSRIDDYTPTRKQWEYICADKPNAQILFSANNRQGKTLAKGYKFARHLTGLYPEKTRLLINTKIEDGKIVREYSDPVSWTGMKFDRPIIAAIGGVTAQTTRDLLAYLLLGHPKKEGWGTGMIPGNCFDPSSDITFMNGGVPGQIDYVRIKHYTEGRHDGYSILYFFSHSSDYERLQGYQFHLVGIDEESKYMVYDELRARTIDTDGIIDVTFTPLKGYSEVVADFLENIHSSQEDDYTGDEIAQEVKKEKIVIFCSVDETDHWTLEKKERIKARWRGHPLEDARIYGKPKRGDGLIYRFTRDQIVCEPFDPPKYWKRIVGLDFPHGFNGTFAAVFFAIEPDSGNGYIYDVYESSKQLPQIYKDALLSRGCRKIPCSWPADASIKDSEGKAIRDAYSEVGIYMLHRPAYIQLDDGSQRFSTWGAIDRCATAFLRGNLKIMYAPRCEKLIKDILSYSEEDGEVKKDQKDHTVDAMHKGWVMREFAEAPVSARQVLWQNHYGSEEFFKA